MRNLVTGSADPGEEAAARQMLLFLPWVKKRQQESFASQRKVSPWKKEKKSKKENRDSLRQ